MTDAIDAMLDAWADTHRLRDSEAESMLARILSSEQGQFGPSWLDFWQAIGGCVSASMHAADPMWQQSPLFGSFVRKAG
jgi:hypothetical protein